MGCSPHIPENKKAQPATTARILNQDASETADARHGKNNAPEKLPAARPPASRKVKSSPSRPECRIVARGMSNLICLCSVCLAEFDTVKGLAALAVAFILYLYWLNFREKRERRRQQRAVEQRRREQDPGVPRK